MMTNTDNLESSLQLLFIENAGIHSVTSCTCRAVEVRVLCSMKCVVQVK